MKYHVHVFEYERSPQHWDFEAYGMTTLIETLSRLHGEFRVTIITDQLWKDMGD